MPLPGVSPARRRFRLMPGGGASGEKAPSDEAIIEAVQRADDRISSGIYDRLFPTVDETLYRVLGHRGPDHDDLVQQAFEQIVITLSRNSFAQLCSLKTWASRVATNVGLNALRSRKRERGVFDRNHDVESGAPTSRTSRDGSAAMDSRVELGTVRRILATLNPDRVEVLLLHDVLGHDLAEIALMVGVSVPAAQSRLFRGRRDLRNELEHVGLVRKERAE